MLATLLPNVRWVLQAYRKHSRGMVICNSDDGGDRASASMREAVAEHIQNLASDQFFHRQRRNTGDAEGRVGKSRRGRDGRTVFVMRFATTFEDVSEVGVR